MCQIHASFLELCHLIRIRNFYKIVSSHSTLCQVMFMFSNNLPPSVYNYFSHMTEVYFAYLSA
jgi:hypothetical protein